MPMVYRIHPAIGIARLGNSDEFFLAPEVPEGPAIEIDQTTGAESTLSKYKVEGRAKKQGARFRVWEHELTPTGLQPIREITNNDATIIWSVTLANKKAAGPKFPTRLPLPTNISLRNYNEDQSALEMVSTFDPISGADQVKEEKSQSRFLGIKAVSLGKLRTDNLGRLIVTGGKGLSERLKGDPAEQMIFDNNDGWYDDTSDGPISAEIVFQDTDERVKTPPAWIIVAPPDFAPETRAVATLFDVVQGLAFRANVISLPQPISFMLHIRPILERTVRLGHVIDRDQPHFKIFTELETNMANLGDPSPDQADFREEAWFAYMAALGKLNRFNLPDYMIEILNKWKEGKFVGDYTQVSLPGGQSIVSPGGIDRAALDQTVGPGFHPGIEAGKWMREASLYEFELVGGQLSPRLNISNLTLTIENRTISGAGYMTARMAIPWQADFLECTGGDNFLWWPAQRPDRGRIDANSDLTVDWIDGLPNWTVPGSHQEMVKNVLRLGFLREARDPTGKVVFVETERDPTLPRSEAMV